MLEGCKHRVGTICTQQYCNPSICIIENKATTLVPVMTQGFYQPIEVKNAQYELEVKQAEALSTLAEGVKELSKFLTQGGLTSLLSSYSKSLSVNQMLGGLAANMGRKSLDAQTIKQNALEITEVIDAVFEKYAERSEAKLRGRDKDIHDGEKELKDFEEKMKNRT